MSLTSAALVSVIALLSPLLIKLARLPLPDIVLQILLGIAIGPQLLGWADVDQPVHVLSVIGLSFLLFLAGLEIQLTKLRGRTLRVSALAFALSFGLALACGYGLGAGGLVRSPLLIAVLLSATSLGIVLPVLEDSGRLHTPLGEITVAGASLAEIIPIVALSLLFSEQANGVGAQLALLITFGAVVGIGGLVIFGFERSKAISQALVSLQDTTAEVRVRGAVALLMAFAALATTFGLEAILGAFLAGLAIVLLDRDQAMTHALFRTKLRAVGFGALVPFFFVATGMSLDVRSLFDDTATLTRVPVFLAALLIARAGPALLYRPLLASRREVFAAGLLQATSLSIPIVGGQIGVDLGLIRPDNYVALVAAGLLSVVLFPQLALRLSRSPIGVTPPT